MARELALTAETSKYVWSRGPHLVKWQSRDLKSVVRAGRAAHRHFSILVQSHAAYPISPEVQLNVRNTYR